MGFMYLGIDYGLKHIGLSISEGNFAEPKETLHPKNLDDAVNQVANKVKEWGIKKIILGISEGKSKERSLSMGNRLKEKTGLEVIFVDETLSSKEAQKLPKNHRYEEHSLSASIILQRFLDDLGGENISDLSYTS
jgi:putative transcription antitermination factor YqgF